MKTSLFALILCCSIQSVFAATYSVPVEEELKVYANFEINSFKATETNGAVTVKYKIPKLLTGIEQEVEFNGTVDPKADTNILTGSNGVLTCSREVQEKMECKVEYKNLQIDKEKAIKIINKISLSANEASGRIAVMNSFSSDPVGFIHY
ncbi:MAG: hypothetical protein PHY93_02990 [Bacteriovorax sp.]|nr:hypothetical protein [Bacteriovorax sp.]